MSERPGPDICATADDSQDLVHELYLEQSKKLVRRLTHATGSAEIARELTHEIFVRLLTRTPGALLRIERPRHYLTRIASNLLRDWGSRRSREQSALQRLPPEQAEVDQIALVEARDTLRRVELALSKLKPLTRQIFLSHRLDGLTYAEIAAVTGLSVSGVEKQMMKAILKLDKVLRRS